jgi:hypothetical protein
VSSGNDQKIEGFRGPAIALFHTMKMKDIAETAEDTLPDSPEVTCRGPKLADAIAYLVVPVK